MQGHEDIDFSDEDESSVSEILKGNTDTKHNGPKNEDNNEAKNGVKADGDSLQRRGSSNLHDSNEGAVTSHYNRAIHSSGYKKMNSHAYSKLQKRKAKAPLENDKNFKKIGSSCVFLYKPAVSLPDLSDYLNNIIEIRISKEYINKFNKELVKRSLWGNDTFTSHSDAVCVLKHSGLFDINTAFQKGDEGVAFFCKVSKARKTYTSVAKNGIKSRAIKGYQGLSLKPESVQVLHTLGKPDELIKLSQKMPTFSSSKRVKMEPINTKIIDHFPQNNLVFNINNELAYKYTLVNICDKFQDPTTWLSMQLKRKTLYLEAKGVRFEICFVKKINNEEEEVFRDSECYKLAKVKDPHQMDNTEMEKNSVPLEDTLVEVIYNDLDWREIVWGDRSLKIRRNELVDLENYKFYDNKVISKKEHPVIID